MSRVDIKAVLSDPKLREKMMVRAIIALQNREGIPTTEKQARAAYKKAVKKGA
jgi:hypothetical protein